MRGFIKLTHILFPLFVGFIIGGVISGDSGFLTFGIILLVLDIIIGIALQNIFDRPSYSNNYEFSSEKQKVISDFLITKLMQEAKKQELENQASREEKCRKRNALCEEFEDAYSILELGGGDKPVSFRDMRNDDAGSLLLHVCEQMPHAPLLNTLFGLYEVFNEELNNTPAIVYKFLYHQNSICENVYIYLVLTQDDKIRLFAVETDFSEFVLCEYSGNSHLNYGRVALKDVSSRIKEILNA